VAELRPERTDEAGVTLIEAIVALFIIATAVVALLGGLGSSIVASDVHRKTVTADAVARSWAEQIQAASWVSCAAPGTPYGAPPRPNPQFTGTVTAVEYGTASGVGAGPCAKDTVTDTVQTMTLVVRATDGRGVARVEIVKRRPKEVGGP
jgi:Tfp pilus assembly protein PilV